MGNFGSSKGGKNGSRWKDPLKILSPLTNSLLLLIINELHDVSRTKRYIKKNLLSNFVQLQTFANFVKFHKSLAQTNLILRSTVVAPRLTVTETPRVGVSQFSSGSFHVEIRGNSTDCTVWERIELWLRVKRLVCVEDMFVNPPMKRQHWKSPPLFAHNFSNCAPRACVPHSRVRLSKLNAELGVRLSRTNVVDVYQIYGPTTVDTSVDRSFRE